MLLVASEMPFVLSVRSCVPIAWHQIPARAESARTIPPVKSTYVQWIVRSSPVYLLSCTLGGISVQHIYQQGRAQEHKGTI